MEHCRGNRKRENRRQMLLYVYIVAFLLVMGALAFVLVKVAHPLYNSPDSFSRKLGELLLQLALIVVVGALVTAGIQVLVDHFNRQRTKAAQDHEKRLDFLRRVRNAHVSVANAWRVIRADPRIETYSEQMRALMLVTPGLEDIGRDVAATTDLFCKEDKESIQGGIEEIVSYLDDGYEQYAERDKSGDGNETFWHLATGTGWLAEFLKSKQHMPERYECALDKSKGKIRSYVYGGVPTSRQNKMLARRFAKELLNAENLAAADELLADNFVARLPGMSRIEGKEAFKERLQHWRAAFPDWRVSIEELIAECDKVAVRWRCEATHRGPLKDIAPTGKRVNWTANDILRIENGRIAESTVEQDMLGLMRQLGAAPEPNESS